jgi:hypothetical protein
MREAVITAHAIPASATVVADLPIMQTSLSLNSDRTVIPAALAVKVGGGTETSMSDTRCAATKMYDERHVFAG